ncbi:putative receptor protein kinase ZmPK1 [Prosopis cineraria]|uniref:putative receptor protein kinase ZmPK1 n=1 Tax=Prosopis cineraria TaxID=364024 RepID=UPI00240EE87A|nr:putative receptor protein kinase ZmPK1 [Prosopis cineraria]
MAFLSLSSLLIFLLVVSALPLLCLSSSSNNLLSLSVENPEHVIKSRNGSFTAGFYDVGENAFAFAIWFTEPQGQNLTVIWMANRDVLVNGKGSTLALRSNGNLVLNDAGQVDVWATNTTSSKPPQLILNDDGNLVLLEPPNHIVWQSFDFPTDTLVPGQRLTRHASLVSSKSHTNPSSGFHKLFFDNDNVLRLVYDGPELSSIYWPPPWFQPWQVGRSTFNASRFMFLGLYGDFISTDNFTSETSDYGLVLQRRLTIDSDGNVRVYSRRNWEEKWSVSWQAFSAGCNIHGICGENSFCKYEPYSGRTCLCLPGYRFKDETDPSLGCEPEFNLSCNNPEDSRFLYIPNGDFYGYDQGTYLNITFDECKNECLKLCNCNGFQYTHDGAQFLCYPKTLLVNGNLSPAFRGGFHLRLPNSSSFTLQEPNTKCDLVKSVKLERVYVSRQDSVLVKVLLWLAIAIGVFELSCVFLFWCLTWKNYSEQQNYDHLTGTGFRKYSYSELKEATRGFNEEIGRGAGGIVYKGVLKDGRVAAIKRLNEANQIESEFLAEVNLIGRLNHMNLIDMWGYCAEGKYRMLVYEYMENGSLAENLESDKMLLDWRKRYDIALGTARGLAYLHEECLEWVLHCDIKPQNILLDSDYKPKVADFGLSKLQNRNDLNNPSFSRIRGTRGYMAPEWVFNLPITSKVDVYSYGIVVLEMITGKSLRVDGPDHTHQGRLVTWVREKKNKGEGKAWVEQVIDPTVEGSFEMKTMEVLVTVALQCIVEDKDARPSMSRVVEMLQSHSIDLVSESE